jgi:hypothetical protein
MFPPVVVQYTMQPVSISQPQPGVYVYDLDQSIFSLFFS